MSVFQQGFTICRWTRHFFFWWWPWRLLRIAKTECAHFWLLTDPIINKLLSLFLRLSEMMVICDWLGCCTCPCMPTLYNILQKYLKENNVLDILHVKLLKHESRLHLTYYHYYIAIQIHITPKNATECIR